MSRSADALVLGAGGMLGAPVLTALTEAGLVAVGQREERFGDAKSLVHHLARHAGSLVVNCIGYLGEDPTLHAWVNGALPRVVADVCDKRGALLVQISTNAVFPPDPTYRWLPTDTPRPTTAYERAKFEGEDPRALVVRASIIGRDSRGRGMLERLLRGDTVAEQAWNGVAAPTLARWLAAGARDERLKPGIVHLHSPEVVRTSDIARWMGSTSELVPPKKGPMLLGGGPQLPSLRHELRQLDVLREPNP